MMDGYVFVQKRHLQVRQSIISQKAVFKNRNEIVEIKKTLLKTEKVKKYL